MFKIIWSNWNNKHIIISYDFISYVEPVFIGTEDECNIVFNKQYK